MADSNRRFIRRGKFCLPLLKSLIEKLGITVTDLADVLYAVNIAVVNISDKEGYCCLVGGLSRSITDRALFQTFLRFGYVLDAEVVLDNVSGRSLGYGFVTFSQRQAMNNAIEEMNGIDLDGRYIAVRKAQPKAGSGRDYRCNGGGWCDLHRFFELKSMVDSNCRLFSETTWLKNQLREPIGLFYPSSVKSSQSPVVSISDEGYCCFVDGLSWSTTDTTLFETFLRFGYVLDAEVVLDKVSGRSRGYGFVTFSQRLAMNDAIEEMNGYNLDGRCITVRKAQPQAGSGRDCFECGQRGHVARECPSKGGDRVGSYGGRGSQYGGDWYGNVGCDSGHSRDGSGSGGGGYEHGNQ